MELSLIFACHLRAGRAEREGFGGGGRGAVGAMSFMWIVTPGNRRIPGMQILQARRLENKQRAEKEEVRGRSPRVALDVVLVLRHVAGDSSSTFHLPAPAEGTERDVTVAQNSVEAAFTCRQIHFKLLSG